MSIKVTIDIDPTMAASESYANLIKELLDRVSQLGGHIEVHQKSTKKPKTRRANRPVSRRRELSGTPAEQWATFMKDAPKRTQDFVQFIQDCHPKFLMQSDAMERLDMTPRAIGGLTGTLRRWAMADGLTLPWVATRIEGNRAWLWCGFDDEGTIKPPPQTFNAINAQNLPPTSYQDFYDRLPKRSQDFIDFLETSGQSTVAQAMEALNVDSPKTLGGLAGSLNRWSRAAGLPIPFKQVKIDGQKGYRWVGLSFIDSEDGEKQSAKIADALPDVVDIVLLEEAVPAASKQFLDLLRVKGRMSQKDVLSAFGLARAQSINKLLSPIQSYIDEHSGLSPVIEEFDGAGQRSYVYRSNDTTESQPIKDDSDGHPEKKDRPGVRIRRRPS